MAWDDLMSTMLRAIINDTPVGSASPLYSDDRLQTLLATSAELVQIDAYFPTFYNVDPTAPSITPDPTSNQVVYNLTVYSSDVYFIILTVLKAAALLAAGDLRSQGGSGIAIRDGRSSIDLRGKLQGLLGIYNAAQQRYLDALWQYKQTFSSVGVAITSPIGIGYGTYGYSGSEYGGVLYSLRDRFWPNG